MPATQIDFEALAREERERGLANVDRCDRTKWCECADAPDESSYYATQDFRHGWFHDPALGGCGGITQTG